MFRIVGGDLRLRAYIGSLSTFSPNRKVCVPEILVSLALLHLGLSW